MKLFTVLTMFGFIAIGLQCVHAAAIPGILGILTIFDALSIGLQGVQAAAISGILGSKSLLVALQLAFNVSITIFLFFFCFGSASIHAAEYMTA